MPGRKSQSLPILLAILASLFVCLAPDDGKAAETEVDLQLVLAVDISMSMDFDEQRAQRDGYVHAFRSSEVQSAIADGLLGKIAVTYVAWAGFETQQIYVPWTLIDSARAADAFADRLALMPLASANGTSISQALLYSSALIRGSGFTSTRKTIDLSGDGPNNSGTSLILARASVLRTGIAINGLPLMLPGHDSSGSLDLDLYFGRCVIGGPASFLYTVESMSEFPAAIRRKLVQEIAEPREPSPRIQFAQGENLTGCEWRGDFIPP